MRPSTKLTEIVRRLTNQRPHSRIHRLQTYSKAQLSCAVKRDDELGFGVTGSKLRKYCALLPYLVAQGCQEAVVIGGAYSNNVVGLAQLLIENRVQPTLFLLGEGTGVMQGNFLLTSLLVSSAQIHWVSRQDWHRVETLAQAYQERCNTMAKVIPEGACLAAALPGALTLPLDILRNESETGLTFAHIFIEAGTGLTAIALILAYSWLNKATTVHVVLLADDRAQFITQLKIFQQHFNELLQTELPFQQLLTQFKLYRPTQAASFGAVNTTIMQTIKTIARGEGFLTDPIYSAKLFYEANRIMQTAAITGNALIIHSGGGLSLLGFQEQLAKLI